MYHRNSLCRSLRRNLLFNRRVTRHISLVLHRQINLLNGLQINRLIFHLKYQVFSLQEPLQDSQVYVQPVCLVCNPVHNRVNNQNKFLQGNQARIHRFAQQCYLVCSHLLGHQGILHLSPIGNRRGSQPINRRGFLLSSHLSALHSNLHPNLYVNQPSNHQLSRLSNQVNNHCPIQHYSHLNSPAQDQRSNLQENLQVSHLESHPSSPFRDLRSNHRDSLQSSLVFSHFDILPYNQVISPQWFLQYNPLCNLPVNLRNSLPISPVAGLLDNHLSYQLSNRQVNHYLHLHYSHQVALLSFRAVSLQLFLLCNHSRRPLYSPTAPHLNNPQSSLLHILQSFRRCNLLVFHQANLLVDQPCSHPNSPPLIHLSSLLINRLSNLHIDLHINHLHILPASLPSSQRSNQLLNRQNSQATSRHLNQPTNPLVNQRGNQLDVLLVNPQPDLLSSPSVVRHNSLPSNPPVSLHENHRRNHLNSP